MYKIDNLSNNENLRVVAALNHFRVFEHQSDLSVAPEAAMHTYFAQKMNTKRRQLCIQLNGGGVTIQSGAMQWTLGNVESETGIKSIGNLVGRALSAKVTGETMVKPEYKGNGVIMLEPTYKNILLIDVSKWGQLVMDDGMFLASDSTVELKTVMRKTLSSAIAGGEGLFNLAAGGSGVIALESPVPQKELIEFTLDNDVLKIDGNMAVAWSGSLQFTVERSSKTLIGSAVNGEGLVNVYRGSGRVLMAPTINGCA